MSGALRAPRVGASARRPSPERRLPDAAGRLATPLRGALLGGAALLALACGSGEPCEDEGSGAVVLTASGSFVDRTFDGECGETTCSLDPGLGRTRCDSAGTVAEGQILSEGEGEGPDIVEIEVYIPPSVDAPGSYDFVGVGGNDGGVWAGGTGPSLTGADEGALVNTLDIDAISAEGASGSFDAEWGGDLPVVVHGTFTIVCGDGAAE